MVGFALLRRIPVQPDLHGRVGCVGPCPDLDGVRAGGQFYCNAYIVEAVRRGNDVVLVCSQNIAVYIALKRPRDPYLPAVDNQARVRAQSLEIQPIVAGFCNGKRSRPSRFRVGRQRIASLHGEIYLWVDARSARVSVRGSGLDAALEPRLTLMTQGLRRNRRARHIIFSCELNMFIAGDSFQCLERTDLPLRHSLRPLSTDSYRVNPSSRGANQHYGIKIAALQRKSPFLVFEQNRRFLPGALDDTCIRFDGLCSENVL